MSLSGIEGDNIFVQLLKPSSFTPVLAAIGTIFVMFSKSNKKRDTGSILLGFAVLMTGMDIMSGAVSGLKENAAFTSILTLFSNPILGVLAGAIFLHSAHHSKPFKLLMGTSCNLGWREDGDSERLWVTKPGHPILNGIERYFDLPHEETYAEPYDIPNPDELILISSYQGSEVFRAGCCYNRGAGKVFYFQPGHESYPTYYDENVRTIIKNAVEWAKPNTRVAVECPHIVKIED